MRGTVFIIKGFVLFTFLLFAKIENSFSQAYNFNYLTIQNGLPQSQAFSILFDADKYAWIGTQGGGLCKYDGEEYIYFTKSDSLLSNRIYCTKEFENKIWIGQKGGVTVLSLNGSFIQNYRLPDNNLIINDIVFLDNDYLFGSNRGVFILTDDKLEHVTENPSIKDANIHNFFITKDSALWLCTNNGLLSYTDVFGKLSKAKGLPNGHVECAIEYNDEWIIGVYRGGVNFYNKTTIYQKEEFKELSDKIILSLFVSEENELWIGTMNNGVYVYDDKEKILKNFRSNNGLSSNHIKTITSDYWNNIWIGTSGGGISIFQNSPFIEYNRNSGLNSDYIFSVLNDSKNNLWLGTDAKAVMRINDTSKVLFDEVYGFRSEKVKSIFEDNDGDIWFGTEGKGLGIFSQKDKKDTIYSVFNSRGLKGNWIKCFAQKKGSNIIYIGTKEAGVFYAKKTKNFPLDISFRPLKVANGKIPLNISGLCFVDGKLWFVGAKGEYGYVEKEQIHIFSQTDKSFSNIVGVNNTLWIGSKDEGILKLTIEKDSITETWMNQSTNQGLKSNTIFQLILKTNQLWVGTERGLDRLDLDSTNTIISAEHFGFEEGFEGVETNLNAGSLDKNGNLWFGTVDGLFLYIGRAPNKSQRKPPALKINDFQIVFESIKQSEFADCYKDGEIIKDLILPYDKNHISFQFKAIHYAYPKNIKYRWKLEGVDRDWTPSTAINVATYPNLAPGEYTFYVNTAIDENWEQDPLTLHFTIDQPYWEKFWFKFAYYALFFLIVLIIIIVIVRRQRKKSKALNEKLKLEKNVLELEQKALRLQMNPHFIFNALNSIHNLIILNDSDKARYALSKFSKLMRQVLENSREKFISIDDEVDTLQNYVQLERLTTNIDIDLIIDIDEDVDTAEEVLPPLMIQPFIENSIVHGLKGINNKGIIKIAFKWQSESILECTIEDNGIGREKASEIKAQKEVYHKSTALQVAQERLANLNKTASFVPFEIIDLYNDKNTPIGTKVIIRLLII